MDWKTLLADIPGTVDQELLLRNAYRVTEHRLLCKQLKGRIRLTDGERKTLTDIAAGVAVRHGLTVVTHTTDHFARIPDLPLENGLEPPQASYRTSWWSCPRSTAIGAKLFYLF